MFREESSDESGIIRGSYEVGTISLTRTNLVLDKKKLPLCYIRLKSQYLAKKTLFTKLSVDTIVSLKPQPLIKLRRGPV